MSLLIKKSVGQLACAVVGHYVSQEDEDKLYIVPSRELETKCMRCNAAILLKVDPTHEDEYFVTEI
ncbi:MAG: hypothetical protein ACREA7_09730 [Nitrosotalea sp.]